MTKQPDVWGLSPEQWGVIGVLATAAAFVIAAIAAAIAAGQLRQSRHARLDQSRPYVMLTAEGSRDHFSLIDLKLENVGAGPAFDVRIEVTPPFRRVKEIEEVALDKARIFTEPIPILPPRYSLTTFFDSARDRQGAGVPSSHQVRIRYHDGHGNDWDESHVLDVDLMNDLLFSETFGVHHVAKSLREIEKLLKQQNKHLQNPIAVTTEPREDYESRARAEHEEQVRQLEAQQAWARQQRAQQRQARDAAMDSSQDAPAARPEQDGV